MRRIERRIDVTEVVGAHGLSGPHTIAASVFLPARVRLSSPPIVVFAFPGGSYSRGYFHLDALPGYSQAEHHTNQGFIVVAADHLGTGDSSVPPLEELTMEMVADANKAAAEAVLEELERGTIDLEFGPISRPVTIYVGQSMGGCLGIVLQGRHQFFDGPAILGFGATESGIPARPGVDPPDPPYAPPRGTHPRLYPKTWSSPAFNPDRRRYAFFWEDVPDEFVAPDMSRITDADVNRPLPMWASATRPAFAPALASPGVVAEEARRITRPVFIGAGERDACPRPRDEPRAYASARDITVCIVPNMAHMHNFAGTREVLWNRLATWCAEVIAPRHRHTTDHSTR